MGMGSMAWAWLPISHLAASSPSFFSSTPKAKHCLMMTVAADHPYCHPHPRYCSWSLGWHPTISMQWSRPRPSGGFGNVQCVPLPWPGSGIVAGVIEGERVLQHAVLGHCVPTTVADPSGMQRQRIMSSLQLRCCSSRLRPVGHSVSSLTRAYFWMMGCCCHCVWCSVLGIILMVMVMVMAMAMAMAMVMMMIMTWRQPADQWSRIPSEKPPCHAGSPSSIGGLSEPPRALTIGISEGARSCCHWWCLRHTPRRCWSSSCQRQLSAAIWP